MLKKFRTQAFATVALSGLLAISGCEESQFPEATGKGSLRGINAIISAPEVRYMIEESTSSRVPLGFKDTTTFRFDDLSYAVNFDVQLAGDVTLTRIATASVDVVANTAYVFALTGTLASPVVLQLEYPERQWTGNETVFEGRALHLSTTAGELDVYYAAPGTAPVLGNARASIGFGEISPAFEPTAGDYELILTTHDDPTDVRYRSRTITQGAATSVIYSVFDPDPSITGNLSVRVMATTGGGAELADNDSPPEIRVMHAAFGTGNTDVYVDDDFTATFVSDLAFGEVSPYLGFTADDTPMTFTPTGDPGVLLLEDSLTVFPGTLDTVFLVGDPAELDIIAIQNNPRPIETTGRVRLVNLADNSDLFDVYIHGASDLLPDIFPSFISLPFRSTTGYLNRDDDSYVITITEAGEKVAVAPPLSLDLALGDVVDLAILDTADPNVFDLVIYGN
ncbi:MAG: DUF4397 domain-containing protein [Woeseiaceae bacterium]